VDTTETRSRDLAPLHAQPIAGLPHSYLMQPDYLMAQRRHKKEPRNCQARPRWRRRASPDGAGAREGLGTLSGFPSK
jgi:hypothetical protein